MSYKSIDFENDCIAWVVHLGEEMRNHSIADGFIETAKIIYESVKEEKGNGVYKDELVYPFLHSIRHG